MLIRLYSNGVGEGHMNLALSVVSAIIADPIFKCLHAALTRFLSGWTASRGGRAVSRGCSRN